MPEPSPRRAASAGRATPPRAPDRPRAAAAHRSDAGRRWCCRARGRAADGARSASPGSARGSSPGKTQATPAPLEVAAVPRSSTAAGPSISRAARPWSVARPSRTSSPSQSGRIGAGLERRVALPQRPRRNPASAGRSLVPRGTLPSRASGGAAPVPPRPADECPGSMTCTGKISESSASEATPLDRRSAPPRPRSRRTARRGVPIAEAAGAASGRSVRPDDPAARALRDGSAASVWRVRNERPRPSR